MYIGKDMLSMSVNIPGCIDTCIGSWLYKMYTQYMFMFVQVHMDGDMLTGTQSTVHHCTLALIGVCALKACMKYKICSN